MADADVRVSCLRFVCSTGQGGFEVFVSDSATRGGDGEHDKECKWKQLTSNRILRRSITDMFLVVCEMGDMMLVWDEIGRARAGVSADASSRALVLQPCERHTLLFLGLCTPIWRAGNPGVRQSRHITFGLLQGTWSAEKRMEKL